MLVMEHMENGSLYDLLHNETMIVDGEVIFPILQDIACGALRTFYTQLFPRLSMAILRPQMYSWMVDFEPRLLILGYQLRRSTWAHVELLTGWPPNCSARSPRIPPSPMCTRSVSSCTNFILKRIPTTVKILPKFSTRLWMCK